ncbi:MAG TPA: hypothetical protein IAB56_05750 [Candidatus Scybalousia intestinigallinarum]|nr:hypothetical protein [Candidatus Scybalousia intestinigallinarum]
MNVIISNERQAELANLDIEVIKSIHGVFDADELVQMFSNFFFGRMILDLTALKNYQDIRNLQKLSMALDVEKIIILLPDTPECLAPQFLSKMISMGIYNFTTNLDGVNYLLNNPNTYRDVAHLQQLDGDPNAGNTVVQQQTVPNPSGDGAMVINNIVSGGAYILGIRNLTDHAGATMLAYLLKKELDSLGKTALAIEVNKRDFIYINDQTLVSVNSDRLSAELMKHRDVSVILLDLNGDENIDLCTDVIYLVEPSTIKLNKLMRRDRTIFEKLRGKKIVLSKSLLTMQDISEFEYEAGTKVFFNLPPLDERANNSEVLCDLLNRLGIGTYSGGVM